jgi:glucan phosphoethanolaminetransferase (alkaline phosphatase superfamily)
VTRREPPLEAHQLALGAGVGVAAAVLLSAGLADEPRDAAACAALALGFAALQALAGTALARVLARPDLAHWASACVLLGLAAAGRVHFALFGVGVDRDTLAMAVDALRAREVVVPVRWLALALVAAGLGSAAVWGTLRAARRVFGARARSARRVLPAAALAGLAVLALPPPETPFGAALPELAPWPTRGARAYDALTLRDADGEVVRLDAAAARRDGAALERRREAVLAGARIARPRDIVMVVLESFRWDLVSAEATPHLAQLERRCLHPERFYATGANTLAGLFGLLHGLSMFHFPAVKESLQQPLPLALLGRLGYRRTLYRGFDLDYAELGDRFFAGVVDDDVAEAPGDAVATDAALVRELRARRRGSEALRFDLVVLYATHWGYVYPKEFERFLPVAPAELPFGNATGSSPLRVWADGLRNRQRNAAAYLDALLGPLFAELAAEPEPPLLVVTGDHGEEFFERGRLGHTWDVNDEMVRVPLWICLPEPAQTRYRHADHSDVFPTLFDALGVETAGGAFTTGKSLLDYDPARDFALTGVPRRRARLRMAVAGDGLKVHFLPFGPLRPMAVLGPGDVPVAEPPPAAVASLLRRAAERQRLR